MNIDKKTLDYRKSTIAVIVDKNNKILLIQKQSYPDNGWDFPGGGAEEGETDEQAIMRELKEELGTDKFELIKKSRENNQYDWPDEVIEKKFEEKGKTWRGQKRSQFLVKFLGEEGDVRIQEDEIRKFRWVEVDELSKLFIFPNQYEKTVNLLKEFGMMD